MIDDVAGIDLGAIFQSHRWQNETSQVIARTYLRDLSLRDNARWTYDPSWLVRHATLLQLGATRLLNANQEAYEFIKLGRFWEASAGLPTTTDRIGMAILSAVAYEIGGSSANGAAVLNKYGDDLSKDNSLLLRALTLLLRRQLIKLRHVLKGAQTADESDFEPLSIAIVAALDDFGEFLLSGAHPLLESAQLTLDGAAKFASSTGAIREHMIASSLRRLTDVISSRSIWRLLEPLRPESRLWKQYLQLLARGQSRDLFEGHSITELWPSQRKAIASGILDPNLSSLVVRMPTSSGKTRVAELAIVQTFVDFPGSKAIYVAPYRALANELLASFRRLLGDLGFAVASSIGSYDYDDLEEELVEDADLAILTPERLDLLLRLRSGALDKVRLVVLDEGHILEDISRGAKVELLFTRLRRRLKNARFLVASAVVSTQNLVDLSLWLKSRAADARNDTAVTTWRPSLQQIATFSWQGNRGFVRFVDPNAAPNAVQTFLPGVIEKRDIVYVNRATQRRNTWHFGLDKSEIAAELSLKLSKLGPVLVYVVQPQWTLSVARTIAKLVDADPALKPSWWGNTGVGPSRSEQIARDWSTDAELETLFSKGVAIHHGDMPDALKDAVERDAREKRFQIIVATGTLSSGVNIPIRSVIFHSSTRYENERLVRISPADYWNIAGRAGRAGLETEGLVVHLVITDVDKQAFEYFQQFPAQGLELTSRVLWSAMSLRSDPNQREDIEDLFDPEVLAIAAEESNLGSAQTGIDELLASSLAAQQAPRHGLALENLGTLLKKRAAYIYDCLPQAERRLSFSQTGLATNICIQMAASLEMQPGILDTLRAGTLEDLVLAIVPVIADVGAMAEIGVSTGSLLGSLSLWLNGASVMDVVRSLQIDAANDTQARRVIDRYFRYYMPWYISSAVRIAACVYDIEIRAFSEIARMLPAIVRYGLPTKSSCYAMSVGIPTRKVASLVGGRFEALKPDGSFAEFRTWLGALTSTTFLNDYGLEGDLLKDVFETLGALRRDDDVLDSLRNNDILPRIVSISVGESPDAVRAIHLLAEGSIVGTRRAYVDLLDRNTIEVFHDKITIGVVRASDSRLLAAALDTGLSISGEVVRVDEAAKRVIIKFVESGAD